MRRSKTAKGWREGASEAQAERWVRLPRTVRLLPAGAAGRARYFELRRSTRGGMVLARSRGVRYEAATARELGV